MRILTFYRVSFLEHSGGTYRVIDDLCRALANNGHSVDYLTSVKRNVEELDSIEPVPGYRIFQFNVKSSNLGKFLDYAIKVPALINKLNNIYHYDAIILHDPYVPFLLNLKGETGRIPITYYFHISTYYENAYNKRFKIRNLSNTRKYFKQLLISITSKIEKTVQHLNLVSADRIITLSSYTNNMLMAHHGEMVWKKSVIIPGGVDLDRFCPYLDKQAKRDVLKVSKNATVFFTLRNLQPRMGLENLLYAIKEAKTKLPNEEILLLIGGKGPLYSYLSEKIAELGLSETVYLVGYITENDLPSFYQASDFFILPTECLEGFGMVTLEALSCNLPVLGTPVGATPEILSQFSPNLTFRSIDSKDMAQGVINAIVNKKEIISNWKSRELVKEKYNWSTVSNSVINLLNLSKKRKEIAK